MICPKCKNNVTNIEKLKCTTCKHYFHSSCLNIKSADFMSKYYGKKHNWNCQDCTNKIKHITTTPMTRSTVQRSTASLSIPNTSSENISPNESLNVSQGDTDTEETITLSRFEELLDRKLNNIKGSLLQEIKDILKREIKQEIQDILKIEIEPDICLLKTNFLEVKTLNEKIKIIEIENQALKQNLKVLQEQLEYIKGETKNINCVDYQKTEQNNNHKKIVIHGFYEYDDENDSVLYERVNQLFHDILNINVDSYIESIRRLGKNGYYRPIEIEMISKRSTNYILENKYVFKGTGLYISKYMSKEELYERKILMDKLKEARQMGYHAVIKNNNLFVNGVNVKEQDMQLNNTDQLFRSRN